MNAQEHRETADAIDAIESGKWNTTQWLSLGSGWNDHSSKEDAEESAGNGRRMRIKPSPVTRPWSKPDDVPGPVCWVRFPNSGGEAMIVTTDSAGIRTVFCHSGWSETAAWEYSTDRKTWHKCEVVE